MLADALPDDFGNALIDAWMAREGVEKSQITSLGRLAYVGNHRSQPPQSKCRSWLKARGGLYKESSTRMRMRRPHLRSDERLAVSRDYGRIEYAYHLMAKAAGITMSPCRLLEENNRAHFMTRRFDRDGNAKHHVQTLCAWPST